MQTAVAFCDEALCASCHPLRRTYKRTPARELASCGGGFTRLLRSLALRAASPCKPLSRFVTAALRALPFGRRLRRRVHPLRGGRTEGFEPDSPAPWDVQKGPVSELASWGDSLGPCGASPSGRLRRANRCAVCDEALRASRHPLRGWSNQGVRTRPPLTGCK